MASGYGSRGVEIYFLERVRQAPGTEDARQSTGTEWHTQRWPVSAPAECRGLGCCNPHSLSHRALEMLAANP